MDRAPVNMNTKRLKNPLRKKSLEDEGDLRYNSPEFKQDYIDYIRFSDLNDVIPELLEVKRNYDLIRKSLPPRAESYLSKAIDDYIEAKFIRPKTKGMDKVYEKGGVQVFVDTANVDGDYTPNSYYVWMIKYGVNKMIEHNRDILPNRKTNIVITDLSKNKHTKQQFADDPTSSAMQANKTIFIDWKSIEDPANYIHEYAHHVADLIPKQSEELLINAYKELLDMYFRAVKRKKLDPSEISDKMRQKIAKKLNFPEYGLTNHHELFAMIIEKWKEFPNNPVTYKFKSLVKKVLSRV